MDSWCGVPASAFVHPTIASCSSKLLFDKIQATTNSDVTIELDNANLWKQFHRHGTEMIVTKNGRRMFPTLRYTIKGLDPNGTYAVFVQMLLADEWRYKFSGGQWVVSGTADPLAGDHRSLLYSHPDSPASGRLWMKQSVSFHRLKLTNNPADPQGHALLYSMHKYQPVVVVVRLHEFYPGNGASQLVAKGVFAETCFYAVTAYQNEKVIQLKINNNPFAKGFRESGKHEKNKAKVQILCETGPLEKRAKVSDDTPEESETDVTEQPSPSAVAKVETSASSIPVTPEDRRPSLVVHSSLPCLPLCPPPTSPNASSRDSKLPPLIKPNLTNPLAVSPFYAGLSPTAAALSYYFMPPAMQQPVPFGGITVYPYGFNFCPPQFTAGHYGFPFGL